MKAPHVSGIPRFLDRDGVMGHSGKEGLRADYR
jgi:hypothetical protein